MIIAPKPSPQRMDTNDVAALLSQLDAASNELAALTEPLAKARAIREYDSDRRKRALALKVREFLAGGDSAAAAETKGRASVAYGEELDQLQQDLASAERTIADHEAARVKWETVRSALSALKAISGNL
jgi:hypothetical protein